MKLEISSFQGPKQRQTSEEEEESSEDEESASEYSSSQQEASVMPPKKPNQGISNQLPGTMHMPPPRQPKDPHSAAMWNQFLVNQ